MDIAVDTSFEPNDAFRATMLAASQPLVLEPDAAPASVPPPPLSLRATQKVDLDAAKGNEAPSRPMWPVLLCAFVAFTFATVAFLKSPLAHHPVVAPYVADVNAAFDHYVR